MMPLKGKAVRNRRMNVSVGFAFLCAMLVVGWSEPGWAAELEHASPESVGLKSEVLAKIRPAVQEMVDAGQLPGATIVVSRHGKIAYHERIGYADIESKAPVREDAIYRMYSMTKPVTSVCIMMLQDRGLLHIDDPVAKHLPEFAELKVAKEDGTLEPASRPITIRDLLNHTAGMTYGFMSNSKADEAYRAAGIFSFNGMNLEQFGHTLATLPLAYQPGTRWHYSVSVDLQGRIIEVVSGKRLDVFMKENLFDPLGMRDTGFVVPADHAERLVSEYRAGPDGKLTATDTATKTTRTKQPDLLSGGGGLVSTARDYFRFAMMLRNKGELDGVRYLKLETVQEMSRNHLPEGVRFGWGDWRTPDIGFGLGFSVRLETFEPKIAVSEFGWDGAASTDFWVNPRQDVVTMSLQQVQPYTAVLEDKVKAIVYEAVVRE